MDIGFILKAAASGFFNSKTAYHGRVYQQDGSNGSCRTGSLFNGRKASSHHPHRAGNADLHNDAKTLEDAFWQGKPLQGRTITSIEVLSAYRKDRSSLRAGFFLQKLCLQNKPHNGVEITPNRVIEEFNRAPARNDKCQLAKARFKAKCCLEGLLLNGRQVTPDAVVEDFPESPQGKLGIARFKAECCHRGLLLNGRKVSPDAVVNDYRRANAPLELARFQERCCQRGLLLNGQQVTPDAVVNDYRAANAPLELARFKEECCLKGLLLNGQQVTPDGVVNDFRAARAPLELARFKEQCCLRGLLLNGQQVSQDAVVNDYRAAKAPLELARFEAECCLRGLPLNGQQVTPTAVANDYRAARAPLELARFKEKCCLRGLPLNGQQVTPDRVVNDFPESLQGKLGIARFKAECCLRDLQLNGQKVTPDAVIYDYKQGPWLLEIAIFYSQLALNAKKLNAHYLNNYQVLTAFQKLPRDYSSRQVDYLILRLKTLSGHDETDDILETFQQAWKIVNNAPVKDDENRYQQCILRFIAMEYELPVDHQRLSAEQVLQTINNLRSSFKTTSLHFFFLAHCYHTNQSLDGQQVQRHQVLDCLQGLPERSKLRHALGCWFEERSANLMDKLLFRRGKPLVMRCDSQQGFTASVRQPKLGDYLPDVIPVAENSGQRVEKVKVIIPNLDEKGLLSRRSAGHYRKTQQSGTAANPPLAVAADAAQFRGQLLDTGEPTASDTQVPLFSSLTYESLEIIQEVNGMHNAPVILITGSFARYLQGIGSSFNDIDIICTTEEAASILINRLRTLNTDMDSEVRKKVVAWPIDGCPEIRLPVAYNIKLVEGDLGTKTIGFQVCIDARVTLGNKDVATVHLPGVDRPLRCLSFATEIRLISDTLEFLADQLAPLTERLQKGKGFDIPRTILFNNPGSPEERICGLLMRCLLTLNKAKQFHSLLAEGKSGYRPELNATLLYTTTLYTPTLCRLQQLTDHLHAQLKSHTCLDHFVRRLRDWITKTQHINDYEIIRCEFIESLLEMVTNKNK